MTYSPQDLSRSYWQFHIWINLLKLSNEGQILVKEILKSLNPAYGKHSIFQFYPIVFVIPNDFRALEF